MNRRVWTVTLTLLTLGLVAAAVAQRSEFRGQFGGRGRYRNMQGVDGRVERNGVPDWKLDEKFREDVFTVRSYPLSIAGSLGVGH